MGPSGDQLTVERDKIGFFLQLRLLLWKNYTLRKRSPIVFLVEVSLPLALFIILLLIRKSNHGQPMSESHYSSEPLPSAGIIPIVQSFCPRPHGGDRYTDDYPRLRNVLERMQYAVDTLGPAGSYLTPKGVHELPEMLQNNADTLANWTDYLKDSPLIPIRDLLKNLSNTEDQLKNTYHLEEYVVDTILNSSVNVTQLLRHFSNFQKMQVETGSFEQTLKRDTSESPWQFQDQLLYVTSSESELRNPGVRVEFGEFVMCKTNLADTFVPGAEEDEAVMTMAQGSVCDDPDKLHDIINITLDQISIKPLLNKMGLPEDSAKNSWKIQEIRAVLPLLQDLQHVSDILPKSSCPHGNYSATSGSQSSGSQSSGSHTSQKSDKDKFGHIAALWQRLSPTICYTDLLPILNHTGASTGSSGGGGLNKYVKEFIIKTLYRNPKILYAPNNTAVQTIIKKVNATFEMFSNMTRLARQWLQVSPKVKSSLSNLFTQYTNLRTTVDRSLPQPHPSLVNPSGWTINSRPSGNTVDALDSIACSWLQLVSGLSMDVFRGFRTETELENYFLQKQYHDNVTVLAGVVFENVHNTTGALPAHIRYKIRQNATLTPDTNKVRHSFWYPSPGTWSLKYYGFGFVWVQDAIERAIIHLQAGREVVGPAGYFKRMPYHCWNLDGFIWMTQHVFPLILMLSWVYSVATLVQRIVYEKEQRLKEVMRTMGLSNAVHWSAWFVSSWIQMTITMAILTLMLHFGQVIRFSNPWIVFIFLELFAMSSIAMSFFISTLFSKAKVAAGCAGIFYFLFYIPYAYISIREQLSRHRISAQAKTGASLFSTSAAGMGGRYFLFHELNGGGVQWDNIMSSPIEHDDFNLFLICLMLMLDSFLYFLLAWYIENVNPGTYGLPKPWYFPFTKSYWCHGHADPVSCNITQLLGIRGKGKYTRLSSSEDEDEDDLISGNESKFQSESEEDGLHIGVTISGLTKIYTKGSRPAIDNLSMKMYEGQITSFLGHNGAGKTTTMSILTGLFPATSGTAVINGHDIETDMDKIRQNLGMCPQHNILFDRLTVEEHLWFYARLKGMTVKDIKRETDSMLHDLHLQEKRSTVPTCLSGGMQRKLSVAIAFVGGSQTVILDEPTAGVDPYSRRSIWNLLTRYKTGRTILLCTHHMDEAEMLGDRICILSNGQLKCSGSSIFLKSSLGLEQHLHVLKNAHNAEPDACSATPSNGSAVLLKVREVIPSAYISDSSGTELHLALPIDYHDKQKLVELFDVLDRDKEALDIENYGITDSSLEEVFIRVTQETLGEDYGKDSTSSYPTSNPTSNQHVTLNDLTLYDVNPNHVRQENGEEFEYHETSQETRTNERPVRRRHQTQGKFGMILNHIRALMVKRFLYVCRNRKSLLSQIILPTLFVSISMTIALSAPQQSDRPPLVLDPTQYFSVTQPKGNFIPYSNRPAYKLTPNVTNYRQFANSDQLVKTLKLASGIGAKCVLKSPFNSNFDQEVYRARNSSYDEVELLAEYFEDSCKDVFRSGVYVPVQQWSNEGTAQPDTGVKATSPPRDLTPVCQCIQTRNVRCSTVHDKPQEHIPVTGDHLQDISEVADEEEFYLNTMSEYRRHRYGGLAFGTSLSYVPDNYDDTSADTILSKLIVKESSRALFHKKGYHSMPTYVNSLNNAILRANLPESKGNPAAYGITVTNHPMKQTNSLLTEDYVAGNVDVMMAILVIVAMAFVPASFVVMLVYERSIKAKHLQFVSGVDPVVYWVTNYLWDMCNYLIPAVCILGVMEAFQIPSYVGKGNIEAVIALFLLYGVSITPMMYPASFVFKEPSVAYISLIFINLFTGFTCVLTSYMMQLFGGDPALADVSKVLRKVFLVFPNFCLGEGLMEISLNQYKNELYYHIEQYNMVKSPMRWDMIGRKLVVMAATGLVFFVFTILCEYRFFCKARSRASRAQSRPDEDSDVAAERQRTLYGSGRTDLLRLENITKVYNKRKQGKVTAVDGLTFSIPPGECFGMLGVNGAGKTTIFKILTGDVMPTSGDAKLNSHSLCKGGMKSVQQSIGYCPQFDALYDELTPREHLHLYARLQGVPPRDEKRVVQWSISKLGLRRYADQLVSTLSGGNKRKVSTAIALIGDPPIVYMDEPTSAMDPYSKRFLWDTIRGITKEGKSVLFTSHSMEECEVLCSRLSIMVNGQLKCLGSIQHLKEKHGAGYTLKVMARSVRALPALEQHLLYALPACQLKDRRHKTLVLDIGIACSGLAGVYRTMEAARATMDISEYSLSQNTLDNVFVNFAKEQCDIDRDMDGSDNPDSPENSGHAETDDEPLINITGLSRGQDMTLDSELLPL